MRNKTKMNQLKSDFTKGSTRIFRMGLDANTIAVYWYLVSCSEGFNPSVGMICRHLRLSKPTVTRAMKTLVECRVIVLVEHARKGMSTKYELMPPKDYIEKPEGEDNA